MWGDSRNLEALGDCIQSEGDIIYFNLNNQVNKYGKKGERVIPSSPAGILCFDPKVGLYHRYAPSISPANLITVTDANVNTTTNILTKTAGTIYDTGNPVKYVHDPTDKIGGLQTGEIYYVIKLSSSTFKLATTRENALNGIAIDITSDGASNNYFLFLNVLDYGASHIERTGGIGLVDAPDHALDSMVFGGELLDYASSTNYEHFNFLVTGFKNIGYFVTPKIMSSQVQDKFQKLYVKNRPLKTGERIIVKSKSIDILGLPVTTPQDSVSCTWSSDNALYTSADLSEVEDFINNKNGECELEIISGAGAGQMSQIESINVQNGVYAITLKDTIEGAASTRVCDIIVENYKLLTTITNANNDTGFTEIPLDTSAKWMKFKFILEGSDVAIEEIQLVNDTHKPSK